MLPSRESKIWDKLADICKEIDLIEKNDLEYEKMEQELDNNLKLQTMLDEQFEIEEEKIAIAFKAENNFNIDDLNVLCSKHKKAELLIIDGQNKVNFDLAPVIKMRATQSMKKGNQLIIMPFEEFHALMQGDQLVSKLTKLSFLHHLTHEFGYVSNMPGYIDHLPHLKEIVLRGCGTAARVKNKIPVYEAKISDVSYESRPSFQGVNQLVIQQKNDVDGKILTKVSWRTIDPETNDSVWHEIVDIENVPMILVGQQPSDAQLSALECIPQMPLLKHSHIYSNALKNTFFDERKSISSEDLAKAKKVVHRARTQSESVGDGFLSEILDGMTPGQKAKVSIKAYIGGYKVYHGRIIPMQGHGFDNQPKAVRVGPSPQI